MNKILINIIHVPKNIGIFLINQYQKYLSFDHSPWLLKLKEKNNFWKYQGCKYYPSCSEYTKQSINRFGLIIGSILGFWRILRCNPFSHGGHDPVPEFKIKKQK